MKRSEMRRAAPGSESGELFCPMIGVGLEVVGRESTGFGCRCDHARATVCGVSRERRLSRLGDSRGVDGVTRDGETRLAGGMAAEVGAGAGGGATPLLCDCLSRSRMYARWLFQRLVRLGWHPLLRVNTGGTFRPAKSAHYQPLREMVPAPGTQWVGTGTAFQGPRRRLNCTLLARWEEGYRDPWLLLTDLAPSAGEACGYGLRSWIEQGFKLTKRGGWQWQRTRMNDPQRAARLWLAVAVATLWLLSVGGMAEETLPVSTLPPLADADGPPARPRRAMQLRLVSVFRQGWITILVAVLNHRRLPQGRWVPEPWPQNSKDNSQRGNHELLLAA